MIGVAVKRVTYIYIFNRQCVLLQVECDAGEFKCAEDNKCINLSYKCDGDQDCDDGSDEVDCPKVNYLQELVS